MADHARLTAPARNPSETWPWHTVDARSIPVTALTDGHRRLEADTYLSSGYAIRQAIERHPYGWVPLVDLASVWMPGRLKGILVDREAGTPFLGATQTFDLRPVPRKWLALSHTPDAASRFVKTGQIFVTCSGAVGRATVAYGVHERTLISHDLLRVDARDRRNEGWLYAFLLSSAAQSMAVGVHYGHIIKHLESEHLRALPVPNVRRETAEQFRVQFHQVIDLRTKGWDLTREAEGLFEGALGPLAVHDWGERGFALRASDGVSRGRRRLEAAVHNPGVRLIWDHLRNQGRRLTPLREAGYAVWLPTRFRRIESPTGVRLLSSSDLTQVNPPTEKRIVDGSFGDPHRGRVEPGWLLMARSGQAHGIIGSVVLATSGLRGCIISDHVLRLRPSRAGSLEAGYALTALSHPRLGMPLVKALTYGSSIPALDAEDIARFPIVRMPPDVETKIANLAEAAAEARAEADAIERAMGVQADRLVNEFANR